MPSLRSIAQLARTFEVSEEEIEAALEELGVALQLVDDQPVALLTVRDRDRLEDYFADQDEDEEDDDEQDDDE